MSEGLPTVEFIAATLWHSRLGNPSQLPSWVRGVSWSDLRKISAIVKEAHELMRLTLWDARALESELKRTGRIVPDDADLRRERPR